MIGRLHSIQSMGAVDGPGVRFVVFLQGCPLRCVYCHNPDTWKADDGTPVTVPELVDKILRYRPYFGAQGGVTVSGGEPLQQGEFVAELFRQLHQYGIHTALDTSGHGSKEAIQAVLSETDLVLCDVKFTSEKAYKAYCKGSLLQVQSFLSQAANQGVPLWIRQVIVPGLNDTPEQVKTLCSLVEHLPTLEKIQLLPFRKLCLEKYHRLNLAFSLKAVPECSANTLEQLKKLIPTYWQ